MKSTCRPKQVWKLMQFMMCVGMQVDSVNAFVLSWIYYWTATTCCEDCTIL